jgi:PelA/Pel-15E family pectate lyase
MMRLKYPAKWMLCFLVTAVISYTAFGQKKADFTKIDEVAFGDASRHWYGIFDKGNIINPKKNQPRYKATQLVEIADNILLYQKNNGGWPKNYDMQAILTDAQKDSLRNAKNILNTTFDNGTTYTHVEGLAGVYSVTHDVRYRDAAIRGINYIMEAQYGNGGWPQYYPLETNYSRHITYNDDAYIGIIEVLKDIVDGQPQYTFVTGKEREKVIKAYNKGIVCILKTQIVDNGKLTAWCQQHDEVTLLPAWARTFEPPSICNGESSNIVSFLMDIQSPSPQIIKAVQSAVAWFRESAIQGIKVQVVKAPVDTTKFRVSRTDRVVVDDPTAPQIWTRYYELKTHRPMFCNRNYKIVYSLKEVERERRDGYGWYTYNPQRIIDRYADWEKKWVK